ncbi:MAG TPA: NAD(P)-dependent oxidoreductase [bacterium]|nr:NAD(P)-dependent oxidoreductase [bacterium]
MAAVRIVIPDDSPPVISGTPALERIRASAETIVHTSPPDSEDDLIRRLRDAHTVVNIRGYCKFTARVLESAHGALRHLAIWGTGTDNVDLAAARRLGIVVSNTPNTATDAIAEHCLALLLAVARRLPHLDATVKRGEWERGMLFQCLGKTLGIIGTGAIGTRFAELGRVIGMRVIAWTLHPDPAKARHGGFAYTPTLEALLEEADVVSLHLRSSPETRGLLGAAQFARMRPGSIFINTARGDIVDEAALAQALRAGKLGGAGIDVFLKEPITNDAPLLGCDTAVLTPHTAGTTPEALVNGLNLCAENVTRFLAEGKVVHRVV